MTIGKKPLLVFEEDATPSANARAEFLSLLHMLVIQGHQHRVDLLHLTYGQDRENKIASVSQLAKACGSSESGMSWRVYELDTPWVSRGLRAYAISSRGRRFLLSEQFDATAVDVISSRILIQKFGAGSVQLAFPALMEGDIDSSLAFRDSRRMAIDTGWPPRRFLAIFIEKTERLSERLRKLAIAHYYCTRYGVGLVAWWPYHEQHCPVTACDCLAGITSPIGQPPFVRITPGSGPSV